MTTINLTKLNCSGLIGESGGTIFRLGDQVLVKVTAVNLDERKIDFVLDMPMPTRKSRIFRKAEKVAADNSALKPKPPPSEKLLQNRRAKHGATSKGLLVRSQRGKIWADSAGKAEREKSSAPAFWQKTPAAKVIRSEHLFRQKFIEANTWRNKNCHTASCIRIGH